MKRGSGERRFWLFQGLFWPLAGIGLFVSGLSQATFKIAFVRNLILFLAGFLTSFFLARLIDRLGGLSGIRQRLIAFPASYVVAVLCTVAVNSVTFVQEGMTWGEMTWRHWFAGAMNFGLVFALWTELYIQNVFGRGDALGTGTTHPPAGPTDRITVERAGALLPIDLADVSHVVAAGDYVEIHTADRAYLERRTIRSLAETLPPDRFLRVHRSGIVNVSRVESLTPLAKGRYRLQLSGGAAIESSRSYRGEIRQRWFDRG